ncbi:hypothetical protein [Sorangium sp. So ce1182]|uniref:hypothetical protein n=1 Tax=Sorangium sp. So ce1182 TaxID=3133334 RepID=UPI003F646772
MDLGAGPLVPRTAGAEAFVAKLDPSGHVVFASTFEGDDHAARDIATDASGNIAQLGTVRCPYRTSAGALSAVASVIPACTRA